MAAAGVRVAERARDRDLRGRTTGGGGEARRDVADRDDGHGRVRPLPRPSGGGRRLHAEGRLHRTDDVLLRRDVADPHGYAK